MSAASASAASTSAHQFSNLLRKSKALQLLPDVPTAITSHAGYLHRNDYGLKRPLPSSQKKTPYVLVRSLDSANAQTDFVSAGKSSLFVKRWDEANIGLTVSDYQPDPFPASPFEPASWSRVISPLEIEAKSTKAKGKQVQEPSQAAADAELQADVQAAQSVNGELSQEDESRVYDLFKRGVEAKDDAWLSTSAAGQALYQRLSDAEVLRSTGQLPDYIGMTEAEFDRYLAQLRDLQPAFKSYLAASRRQAAAKAASKDKRRPTAAAQSQTSDDEPADLYESALKPDDRFAQRLIDFLRTPSGTTAANGIKPTQTLAESHQLERQPHPNAALSYAPADPQYTHFTSPTFPARVMGPAIRPIRTGTYAKLSGGSEGLSTTLFGIAADLPHAKQSTAERTQFEPDVQGHRSNAPGSVRVRVSGASLLERTDQVVDPTGNAYQPVWPFESIMGGEKALRDVASGGVSSLAMPGLKLVVASESEKVGKRRVVPGSTEWVRFGGKGLKGAQKEMEEAKLSTPIDVMKQTTAKKPSVAKLLVQTEGGQQQGRKTSIATKKQRQRDQYAKMEELRQREQQQDARPVDEGILSAFAAVGGNGSKQSRWKY